MSVKQAYNFKQIDSSVSTSGLLSEEQLGELANEGYEALINLLPSDSEYANPNEPAIVESQGIEYIYIPVDFSAPTEQDYEQFATRLAGLSGKKVMLHCAANYRVSAFYAIYAVQNADWSEDEARKLIGAIWDLDAYPAWAEFVGSRIKG